jgi:hypothetical protein
MTRSGTSDLRRGNLDRVAGEIERLGLALAL